MRFPFVKMHGCGNDYIYFDCMSKEFPANPSRLSIRLSDRHFGIGGDGIVLILPSGIADAKMRMFNADGSEGKMCGNAIRCVAKHLHDNKIKTGEVLFIETLSGVKKIKVIEEDGVCVACEVDMGKALFAPVDVPTKLAANAGDAVIGAPFSVEGISCSLTCVSMGNPHAAIFLDSLKNAPLIDERKPMSLSNLDLAKLGPLFEGNPLFPESVNTEFIALKANGLDVRVWERGSGETLACGTGACACVAAAVANGFVSEGEEVLVSLPGGDLKIRYKKDAVIMAGPCVKAFEGVVELG
jgi:diaminopimelate epimerase